MTGIQMLLKQLGLDPEKVQLVFNQFTEQIPGYLNAVGQKVNSIDARLLALEYQNAAIWALLCAIAEHLKIEVPNVPNKSTAQLTACDSGNNGHAANASGS